MKASEMLNAKREVDGFELFNALVTGVEVSKMESEKNQGDFLIKIVMALIFDEEYAEKNSKQAAERKEKFGPLVEMLSNLGGGEA